MCPMIPYFLKSTVNTKLCTELNEIVTQRIELKNFNSIKKLN